MEGVNNLHLLLEKDSLVLALYSEKEQIPMSDNTFRIITYALYNQG